MSHRARYGVAVAAVTATLAASACSGGHDGHDGPASAPASTSGLSSTSTTTPSAGRTSPSARKPVRNPLNGSSTLSRNGVVAVKIDDTANGRPQVNINEADIVYIEQVEGGLSRLLAVFNTHLPVVEAVRSTRASDPELVGSYGPIAYVASGGAHNPLQVLDRSPLKTAINDRGGPGFARDNSRSAPYNLRANLATIAKALKAPRARPVGFQWAYQTSQLKGRPDGLHVRTLVGTTPVAFDYNPKSAHYRRIIGGAPQSTAAGVPITASDVLVQFCSVTTYYKDIDVNGSPSKYTHTIGSGRAVLFRNGKRIVGTWTRKHYTGSTAFRTGGQSMIFRPGDVWVVLVANGAPLP